MTRCCTGTPWSPTSSKAPTGGGRRSSTPSSTGPSAPRARCSRRCCGPSSPSGSGSSGGPGRHVPEIAGVPQALCDLFSKRSQEIEDWLEATGTPDDPAGRQEAVLATRRNKPEVEHERFDTAWKAEALDAGWGPDAAEALIATAGDGRYRMSTEVWRLPEHVDDPGRVDRGRPGGGPRGMGRRICAGQLTEADSTFTRPQLVQAVAARIGEGATMATLERVVARVMASPTVVPVGDDGDRWTSTELLAVERRFLHTADTARATRAPLAPGVVDRVIGATPTLGCGPGRRGARAHRDHRRRVRAGRSGRDRQDLHPRHDPQPSTRPPATAVQGAAPSARAAHELSAGAHIASSTIHRLLGSWSRGFDLPDARTLLVVDEAAMAGIRDLETVVTRAIGAGGRVLLVGDHRQLPEVTAGGGFAALAVDQRVTVAELTVNRRQQHRWERDALIELRDGHVATAVAAYRDAGSGRRRRGPPGDARRCGRPLVRRPRCRAVAGADRRDQRHRRTPSTGPSAAPLKTEDCSARRSGRGRDETLRSVNGWCCGSTTTPRQPPPAARASVLNGQTATLTAGTDAGVVVRLDHDHAEITLGADYLDAGGVDHGYALTAHRAQGGTWDLAISVGADGLYREAAYLVLSRGRHENWLVLTAPELDDLDAEVARHDSPIPLPGEAPDIDDELNRRLNTSRAKLLALTRDPYAELVAATAAAHDLATLEARAAHARQVEQRATTIAGIDPTVAGPRLDRAVHTATPCRASARPSRPSTGTTSAPSSPSTTPPGPSESSSSPPTAVRRNATCGGTKFRSWTGIASPGTSRRRREQPWIGQSPRPANGSSGGTPCLLTTASDRPTGTSTNTPSASPSTAPPPTSPPPSPTG